MEYEIVLLSELIKKKTGKEVCVFTDIGNKFFSTCDEIAPDRPDYKITGIVGDEKRNKTYFRFVHKSETYLGYINGAGDAEKQIAGLSVALMENGVVKAAQTNRTDLLRAIILGEENGVNIRKYMNKFGVPEGECSAYYFVAQPKRIKDLMNFLENFKSNEKDCVSATDDNSCAYVHFYDSLPIDGEYQSLSEYAELLVRSIYDELGISVRVGVGEKVKSFEEIAVSYAQAVTANRMRAIFNENASVATYKEYVLIKLLEEVPKYKLQELLDILLEPDAKSLLSDEEMIKTAEEFLGTNLNVSETSRNLFMHRNTLMYRLDKIARTTGLDVRKFQDAATFRIVLILNRILNNKV